MKKRSVLPMVCTAIAAVVLVWSVEAYAADAQQLFKKGRELQKAGKLEEALKTYNECLTVDPNYYKAIFAAGRAHFGLKNYAEAARMFESALAFQPASLKTRLYLADSRARMGRVETAKSEYRRILEHHPDNVTALIGLGRAEFMSGNRFAAVETFKKALKLQPSNRSLRASIERLENSNLEYIKMSEELRRREVISALNNAIAEDAAQQARLREEAAARKRAEMEGKKRQDALAGSSPPGEKMGPVRAGKQQGAGRRTRYQNDME